MALLDVLKSELTVDPEAIGYAGMDDAAAAVALNDRTKGRTLPVDSLSSAEIYELINRADWSAVSASDKAEVKVLLGLGDNVRIAPGSKAREVLVAAFAAGTTTKTALAAAAKRTVSRAEELGLRPVFLVDVTDARSI